MITKKLSPYGAQPMKKRKETTNFDRLGKNCSLAASRQNEVLRSFSYNLIHQTVVLGLIG